MAQWWKDEIQARCPQADGFVGVSGYEDIAQVIAQALEDRMGSAFPGAAESENDSNQPRQ